jgi:hypothetical protein
VALFGAMRVDVPAAAPGLDPRVIARRVLLCGATLVGVTGCIDVPALTFEALDAAPGPVADARPGDGAADAVANPVEPDAAGVLPAPDAAVIVPPLDAALPPLDAALPVPDATPPLLDAAPPLLDAALPLLDAALPLLDAALPVLDAAPPLPDAALPPPDVALPVPDAALPVPDAAPPLPDAAPPLPDAALPPPPPVILPVPAPLPGLRFGTTVAVVADQNADGFADVVVGAPNVNAATDAYVFLLDGRSGQELGRFVKPADSGSFGRLLMVADADADGTPEVILGEPVAANGRGRVRILGLPGLAQIASASGDQGDSALGTALTMLRAADGTPRILASAGGPQANDQLFLYRFRLVQPGLFELAREQSFALDNEVRWDTFGRALAAAPGGAPGVLDEVIVSGLDAGPRVGRVARFTLGQNVRAQAEYRPDLPTETAGATLLVLPTEPAQLAVGDPGGARGGVVSIFPREVQGGGSPPTLELHSRAAGEAFGTALATAPLLSGAGRSSGGLCVGAPASGAAIGRVECMDATAPDVYLSLEGPAGTAFGTSVSAGATLDPDGTWLMAVGAPAASGAAGHPTGAVMVIRVTPPAAR